jgi:hypothetical protein
MRRLSAFVLTLVVLQGCPASHSNQAPGSATKSGVGGPDAGGGAGDGSSSASSGAAGSSANGAKTGGGSGGAVGSSTGSAGSSGGSAGSGTNTGGDAGADSGSMTGATAPVPLSQLPDAFAGAICDAMQSCVGGSALMQLTNGEDCATRVAAELRATEFAYMDKAIASGHVLYDSSPVPACLDGIRALGCNVLSHSFPAPCVDVLAGNVKTGDVCTVSAECAGTAFCAGTSACPSHCAALLAEGDACNGNNECGDDLMCVTGHCLRPSLAGEPCNGTSGKVCRLGFNCSGATDTQTGMCVDNASIQVGALGASCEPGGALCKEGLSCVYNGSSAFHCEAGVASGAACHLGLPKQCPSDEYCDATDVTTQSTCKKLPGDGKPCALQKLCAAGSTCVDDGGSFNCHAIQTNGNACTADDACRSSSCVSGLCAPPPACM